MRGPRHNPWRRLWRSLAPELRGRAATAWYRSLDRRERAGHPLTQWVARRSSFRPRTVASFSAEKWAAQVSRIAEVPPRLVELLITAFLFAQGDLLPGFLDAVGLRHEEGRIDPGELAGPPIGRARLAAAVEALFGKHDAAAVHLYLDVLEARAAPIFAALPEVRRAAGARTEPVAEEEPAADEEAPEDGRVPPSVGFTTLDRLVVKAVVDGVSEVEGALGEDELVDLVEEVVHLNSDRHSSYFHRGFLDVLQGRDPDAAFPEANATRRAWYWSGVLHGLERRNETGRMRELASSHPGDFRDLGSGRHEASGAVAGLLFGAFRDSDERGTFLDLVGPRAVGRGSAALLSRMVEDAAGLLRLYRHEEARPLLALVDAALRFRDAGTDLPPPRPAFQFELERRQAHCSRLAGDFVAAKARLERLVGAPWQEAMPRILTDLGLIECRIRSLGEIRLPSAASDRAEYATVLGRGEEWFRKATAAGAGSGGHGEYALGVLLLARGKRGEALPLLERAETELSKRAEVFQTLGILPRVRLYLALSLAETLEGVHARRIADLLLRAGPALLETFDLTTTAMDGLAMLDRGLAVETVRALGADLGSSLLDAVVASDLLEHVDGLRSDLADRMRDTTRSRSERFADSERLLAASLAARDHERALEALEELEGLSDAEPGRSRFLDLLADPERFDPAWDADEAKWARIRILEATGDLQAAAGLLVPLAHAALSGDEAQGLVVARGIADRIESYGLVVDPGLVRRIAALAASELGGEALPERGFDGSIVLVGGVETQGRLEDRLRQDVAASWPGLTLVVRNTGMNSNSGRQFDAMRPVLDGARGIVIMRLVRTNLGRTLRRFCNARGIPWMACTGRGLGSMLAAIGELVRLVTSSG